MAIMPFFQWTDDLSVGIAEFDSHHKHLVQLINKLHASLEAGDEEIALAEVLTELSNYTLYHFFAEEDAMARYDYPRLIDHRGEHVHLTDKTLGFLRDFKSLKGVSAADLLDFLMEWLKHHILETDKAYGPHLNENGLF
jgi:hemerythrin